MEVFITTSELLEKAEKLIGVSKMPADQINYTKLLRWQREGLLPKQKSSGTGPGGRMESLWDKSCIARIQIIVSCVKGERLNLKKAEHALIASGFGVQGKLLKKHLLEACEQMTVELEMQQRSASSDPIDQASNLERSTSDRMWAFDKIMKSMFVACRLGYAGLNEEAESLKLFANIAGLFQPHALQKIIETKLPEQLESAYHESSVLTFAEFIAHLFDLMYGKSKELPMLDAIDNTQIKILLDMFLPNPDGKLRRKKPYPYSKELVRYNAHLTATLIYLLYSQYKEKLLPLIPLVVAEILKSQKILSPDQLKSILNTKLEEPNALFKLPRMS